MSKPTAIIDTSVLLCLFRLNILDKLNLLFSEIRVPRKVESEFLFRTDPTEASARFKFITSFYESHRGWFIRCNEYDSATVEIYIKIEKLDPGESEVFAQNQYLENAHTLLIDEKKARKVALKKQSTVHGFLFILASLDIKYGICDYQKGITILQKEGLGHFPETLVKSVYQHVKDN